MCVIQRTCSIGEVNGRMRIARECRTMCWKDFGLGEAWSLTALDRQPGGGQEAPSACASALGCVFQLQNQSELRAPTAEKAAFFLDAAIASRRGNQQDCDEDDLRNSHMLFTLHIYQYRMEKSGKGGSKSPHS